MPIPQFPTFNCVSVRLQGLCTTVLDLPDIQNFGQSNGPGLTKERPGLDCLKIVGPDGTNLIGSCKPWFLETNFIHINRVKIREISILLSDITKCLGRQIRETTHTIKIESVVKNFLICGPIFNRILLLK